MFHYEGVLPHLLSPADYYSEGSYQQEMELLFRPSWQYIGLLEDVSRPGDYLARDVLGEPVVLRNMDGELHAFKNICAHRHSLVVPPGKGKGSALRCQYHGWEYRKNGSINKMPDGESFKGIRANHLCLKKYRVDTLGSLVFVNLSEGDKSFLDSVGGIAPDLQSYYHSRRQFLYRATEHPVNWKVIAENAIESYHVPIVHPNTFKNFRDEHLHDHRLDTKFTRYKDLKPWGNSPLGLSFKLLAKMMLREPKFERFTQTHVFPNYLLYYGDLLSSFIALEPLGPERTRHVVIWSVPLDIKFPLINRPFQKVFELAFSWMGGKLVAEDGALWGSIQNGLRRSHQKGALSRREERVYTFQQYVVEKIRGSSEGNRKRASLI